MSGLKRVLGLTGQRLEIYQPRPSPFAVTCLARYSERGVGLGLGRGKDQRAESSRYPARASMDIVCFQPTELSPAPNPGRRFPRLARCTRLAGALLALGWYISGLWPVRQKRSHRVRSVNVRAKEGAVPEDEEVVVDRSNFQRSEFKGSLTQGSGSRARSFGAVREAVEFRHQRVIGSRSKLVDQTFLYSVPALARLDQYLGALLRDLRRSGAGVRPFGEDDPSVSNHRVNGPVQRRPIHFEFVRNPGKRLTLPARDASQHGQLGDVNLRARESLVVGAPENA